MQSGARETADAGGIVPMAPVKSGPGSTDSRLFWLRRMKRKEPSETTEEGGVNRTQFPSLGDSQAFLGYPASKMSRKPSNWINIEEIKVFIPVFSLSFSRIRFAIRFRFTAIAVNFA